jgi:uracil-DNA glycosylase
LSSTEARGAAAFLPPPGADLAALREASRSCRGCPLYRNASGTVFGVGAEHAEAVLVGEQPGDHEDRSGEPFVGPAGRVLREVTRDSGLETHRLYVTNAVKHFKFERRGKVRLHKQPTRSEVTACEPWLRAELQVTNPLLVVCLGATAAKAVLGPSFRVSEHGGEIEYRPDGQAVLATYHPAAVLNARDANSRRAYRAQLVRDLGAAASYLVEHARAG